MCSSRGQAQRVSGSGQKWTTDLNCDKTSLKITQDWLSRGRQWGQEIRYQSCIQDRNWEREVWVLLRNTCETKRDTWKLWRMPVQNDLHFLLTRAYFHWAFVLFLCPSWIFGCSTASDSSCIKKILLNSYFMFCTGYMLGIWGWVNCSAFLIHLCFCFPDPSHCHLNPIFPLPEKV